MARTVLFGTSVSPGIAIGRLGFANPGYAPEARALQPGEIETELALLHSAADAVYSDLERTYRELSEDLAEYREVIGTYMLLCRDPKLLRDTGTLIRSKQICAAWALHSTIETLYATFQSMEDPYMRDRGHDIRTVGLRLLKKLAGISPVQTLGNPCIYAAADLSPADTLDLNVDRILALVTAEGGPTSHTAILARSLRIPAVVGVSGILEDAHEEDFVIVDALRGIILIEPDEQELEHYSRRQEEYISWERNVRHGADLPAETLDGVRIHVQANIENPSEASAVLASGAEGVGLYRTEFAYLRAPSLPTEERLYAEYAEIARQLAPRRVVFRTLDAGADKMLHSQVRLKEPNPALGLRAIRFCLRHQNIFRSQLRAILHAGLVGNVSLMLPMISGTAEVQNVRRVINEVSQELLAEGIPHCADIPIGIMIEVPSAVMVADALARECDFFSIGTNDLIHYLLAIDRGNKHVGYLHDPLHPAVMLSLKRVIDCAHREGIGVTVCGELGTDPYCLAVLVGMGIDGISATPQSIPGIKHLVRSLDAEACSELARSILMSSDSTASTRMVRETLADYLHDELAFHTTLLTP